MGAFVFLDPTAEGAAGPVSRARTLGSLAGRRVALFDNNKTPATPVLERIGEWLVDHYGVTGLVAAAKPNYSAPAETALLDRVAQEADAVVFAIAA